MGRAPEQSLRRRISMENPWEAVKIGEQSNKSCRGCAKELQGSGLKMLGI